VFGARSYGIPSRFVSEIPSNLTDREEQGPTRPGALRARATSWSSSGYEADQPAPVAYRLGDDVAHPTFGEGVVTGLEPGGIVVIRFSEDASERKLVADLAPITKR
jgi:DNA helicase-2/ATP-dependent DNA helicase PcrA